MYLTAIIDWYSQMILSWRLSNTMGMNFCIDCLQDAFENYGEPEMFNSDQGSQYTCRKYLDCITGHATKNSMDGKGRWVDNVIMERFWWTAKYEHVHLHGHETPQELQNGLDGFINWYNNDRTHLSLSYDKPGDVYFGRTHFFRLTV